MAGAGSNIVGYSLTKYFPKVSFLRLTPTPAPEAAQADADAVNKALQDNRRKFYNVSQPLFSFVFGCLLGALTMFYGQFWCLFIPIAVLVFFVAEIKSQEMFLTNSTNKQQSSDSLMRPASTLSPVTQGSASNTTSTAV